MKFDVVNFDIEWFDRLYDYDCNYDWKNGFVDVLDKQTGEKSTYFIWHHVDMYIEDYKNRQEMIPEVDYSQELNWLKRFRSTL